MITHFQDLEKALDDYPLTSTNLEKVLSDYPFFFYGPRSSVQWQSSFPQSLAIGPQRPSPFP